MNKFLAAAHSLKSGIRSSAKSRATISPEKLLLAPKSASSVRNSSKRKSPSRDLMTKDVESDVSDAESDVSIETAVSKYGDTLTGIILYCAFVESGFPHSSQCEVSTGLIFRRNKIGLFTVTRPTLSKTPDCKLFFHLFFKRKFAKQYKNWWLDRKVQKSRGNQ